MDRDQLNLLAFLVESIIFFGESTDFNKAVAQTKKKELFNKVSSKDFDKAVNSLKDISKAVKTKQISSATIGDRMAEFELEIKRRKSSLDPSVAEVLTWSLSNLRDKGFITNSSSRS